MKQHPPQVGAKHHQQPQGGQLQPGDRGQGAADESAQLLLPVQGGGPGQAGGQDQIQRPQEHRGQGQHGQGHARQNAEAGGGGGLGRPARHQHPGDQGGVGRAQQMIQQGVPRHRQGDGGNVSQPSAGGLPGAGAPGVAEPAAVEQGQGAGGPHLAQGHARNDQPRRPLRMLGQKGGQQAQHRRRPDQLLDQFGYSGSPDPSGPEKDVLVDIFHPGEGHAGQQQDQPQLGPGVPQQTDGDGVGPQYHHGGQGEEEQKKQQQTGVSGLGRPPPVPPGQLPGGEIGGRRRHAHRGEGQQHGIHRHEQLIQPHDLGPHHPGQRHPIGKAKPLRQRPQHREKHHVAPGGPGLRNHSAPSLRTTLCPGDGGYPKPSVFCLPCGRFYGRMTMKWGEPRNELVNFQAVEKVLPAKGFGRRDRWKGDHQGPRSLKSTTFSLR